jgi:hypothetical protein
MTRLANSFGIFFAAAAIAVFACGAEANATAFAGVRLAYWRLTEMGPLPSGIEIVCTGDAVTTSNGCIDTLSLSITDNQQGLIQESASSVGGFTVENLSDVIASDIVKLQLDWSAFNPGGPETGASVTDPATEWAYFNSSVVGPAGCCGPFAQDFHGCDTRTSGSPCGVGAPDSSETYSYDSIPAEGSSQTVTYNIGINLGTYSVPEPSSWSLLATMLGFLGIAKYLVNRARTSVR